MRSLPLVTGSTGQIPHSHHSKCDTLRPQLEVTDRFSSEWPARLRRGRSRFLNP